MIERLKFILYNLEKLHTEDRIRFEGNGVFQEARAELADVIRVYQEPVPVVPAPVINMMTDEQARAILHIVSEETELAVIDAITASKDEVIAAIAA